MQYLKLIYGFLIFQWCPTPLGMGWSQMWGLNIFLPCFDFVAARGFVFHKRMSIVTMAFVKPASLKNKKRIMHIHVSKLKLNVWLSYRLRRKGRICWISSARRKKKVTLSRKVWPTDWKRKRELPPLPQRSPSPTATLNRKWRRRKREVLVYFMWISSCVSFPLYDSW